jgi:hypothetical protein
MSGSRVNLYWDDNFGRLYIPLHIKTKNNARADQGACALLMGVVENDTLRLYPALDSAVFDSKTRAIFGATGPNQEVCLHKVVVLHTSTGLPYLIAHGGNGNAQETEKMVHAVPLLNQSVRTKNFDALLVDQEHGAPGKKNDTPELRFYEGSKYMRFRGRWLEQAPTSPRDMYHEKDQAVTVGCAAALPDPIVDIFALQDCVFVITGNEFGKSGLFYSQALFDEHGRIVSWTPWHIIYGVHPGTITVEYDLTRHSFLFIERDETGAVHTRAQRWSVRDEDAQTGSLIAVCNEEFPPSQGGIAGLFEFPASTIGLSNTLFKSSLLVAVGNKKLLLMQTVIDQLSPVFARDMRVAHALQGGFPSGLEPSSALTLEGGVLDTLSPLSVAAIIHDATSSYLMIGGCNGLAILSDKDNKGWQSCQTIGKELSAYVKKIIQDAHYLYILTKDRLERINVLEGIQQGFAHPTILAQAKNIHNSFTDMLVCGPLLLLATTGGLLRNGNGTDIRLCNNDAAAAWSSLMIPRHTQYIEKLFALSPTGNDVGFGYNGQLYVLSGSVISQDSQVHRFFVRDVRSEGVTDYTVHIVPDFSYQGNITNFITFGGYRNNYATDGLIHLSSRGGTSPLLHVLPGFVGGKLIPSSRGSLVSIPWKGPNQPLSMVKNSVTGGWLVAGDFGLCVYQ